MKNRNKILITTIVLLAVIIVAALYLPSLVSDSSSATPTTIVITDMAGVNVTIPTTINRIVVTCQGGVSQEIAALGGADKIVSQPSMAKFPTYMKMYPSFNNVTNAGSFSNINVETILGLNPDIVIGSKGSVKTDLYQKLVNAGIPVVGVNTGSSNVTAILNEFRMMGVILNNPEQADKLINFWTENLQAITDRLQNMPSEDRKRVYYVLGSLTHTNGKNAWGQTLITAAGGINVAEDMGTSKDLDIEQLLAWNPEVMILSSNEGSFVSIADVTTNTQLNGIAAVENNELYLCPIGTFWWDRPAPEAILGITWLAKSLYPTQLADIDLYSLSQEFYQTFYGYSLSTSEFEAFLAPTA